MRTVAVRLGTRSYQIQIASGLLDELGEQARDALGERTRQAVVVSNATLGSIYSGRAVRSLARAGFKVHSFSIGDGEQFKSLRTAESLFAFLIEHRIERSDVIVAMGGGVVGDLAGFVAATYLRGIRLIQVPTTLLAQIDSSVGGKTGVNHPMGKNLIGAFHQPRAVLIDTACLATLPDRELSAGLAEVIKYGAIRDRRLLDWLEANLDALLARDGDPLGHAI